ncbi:MAG: hypothetical protein ACFWTJ_08300 [Lachnoclostridium sp.]
MINSIQHFEKFGIINLENVVEKFLKNPKDIASFVCGVKDIVIKLGLDIIKETLENCDEIIRNSEKRKQNWQIHEIDIPMQNYYNKMKFIIEERQRYGMELGIIIIAIITAFFIKANYDKKKYYERTLEQLKESWGKIPQQEYTYEHFQSIAKFYMELGIIIIAIITAFFIKANYDKKKYYERTLEQLKESWGKIPQQEYTYEHFQSIAKFYQSIKDPDHDLE